MMKENLTEHDIRTLIHAALSINDKLKVEVDHVEFTGSMNDAEDFCKLINNLWHKAVGWTKTTTSHIEVEE